MRKDTPPPRPRAAIFSFRDNEYSSHAEVKYLIETQIGVKVKSIQFDPLDIRVCKPDVHSRWIVDFYTDSDLEKVVKKGLVVGKDKLLFYRHDDIVKREVSSFKFFMTVMEAKKKFKKSLNKKSSSDKDVRLKFLKSAWWRKKCFKGDKNDSKSNALFLLFPLHLHM